MNDEADYIAGLSTASGSFSGSYDASVAAYLFSHDSNPERDIVMFPKGMRPWHPMLTSRGRMELGVIDDADGTFSVSGDFELKWPWRHEHVGVTRWIKHLWMAARTHE